MTGQDPLAANGLAWTVKGTDAEQAKARSNPLMAPYLLDLSLSLTA